ncbi:MAG: cysteine-rich VLP protein [Clostridia bacterium]|nr:cysteine-rich VLP protein [Clostridia bacterium]
MIDPNRIRKNVRHCCNYVGGRCILADARCVQWKVAHSVACKVFEQSVLPSDKELYEQYLKVKG